MNEIKNDTPLNKRLTVVIPGWNTPEAWWRRALVSVLAAIGPNDEVFCVDDGSTIDTHWLDEMPNVDSRINVIRLDKNRGLPSARNAAIGLMRGKYVTFVDSDDEVRPDCYSRCLAALERDQSDIAIYGLIGIWENDGLCREVSLPDKNYGVLTGWDLHELHKECLFDYACNKVYRKSFLDEHHLWFETDVRTGEDTVFNLSCVMAGAKWSNVDYIGYVYYRRDGTMLSSYVPNALNTYRRKSEIWHKCKQYLPEFGQLVGRLNEFSEIELQRQEWKNLWKRNSPLSLRGLWRYLCQHREVTTKPILVEYFWQMCYGFLRRYFYTSPIRRYHIKRLYPDMQKWPKCT